MKKVLLVVNPSSGGEKAPAYEELAIDKLASYFDEVLVKHTEKAGDATRFAKEAAQQNYHSIFVMGGDGTVNEGISGIAEMDYRPKFGFFPLGTVNDLARSLGLPLDPEEAIINLDLEVVRPLDIGKVNNRYFMNIIAIGTIPESINNVNPEEKTKWGKAAYFLSGVRELLTTDFHDYHLSLDGQLSDIKTSTILIGLTNSIGGFETILPNAKVDDGLLHLVYVKDQSLFDTVKAVPDLVAGVSQSTENLVYQTFIKGSIELIDKQVNLAINVDGDEGDTLPISVEILPSHLEVYAR
ncbi:diacylglycerol/lipid kinase family protein [Streptococcus cameli]